MPQLPVAKGAKRLSLPMRLLKSIRLSPSFNRLMTLVILFNCASFVLDGREVSANLQRFMEVSNFACLIIFTIEILICACADGIKEYLRVSWNIFDVIVVGLSWIFDSLSGDSGFSVFRVMRILKPLRLLKRIGSLQDLLEMYGLSARAFASVFLVLFIFLLLFAIVGIQLFANQMSIPHVCTNHIYANASDVFSVHASLVPLTSSASLSSRQHLACRPSEDGNWWDSRCKSSMCRSSAVLAPRFQSVSSISRSSFDSIGPSLFTVYCMLYLEGWSDLMYDSMHSVSASMPVYWVLLVIVLAFGLNRQVIPRLVALVACSQFLFDFTCFYFHFSAIICSSIVIHQQYAQHFLGRDV